mgnify:CR=1 FL=1
MVIFGTNISKNTEAVLKVLLIAILSLEALVPAFVILCGLMAYV